MNENLDEAAQQNPAWVAWARPQRIAAEIDRLFTETLPRVPIGGTKGWTTPAGLAVPPMPRADRYSDEMKLYWITDVFDYFFPDEDSIYEPEQAEVADQFVCYIGEYFVQHCGGRWVNDPTVGGPLYEFGPAIAYDWTGSTDFPVDLLFTAVEEHDFSHVTDEMYSRGVDYAEAHGLPHEVLELQRRYSQKA